MLRATCPEPGTGSGKLWDDLGSTQFVTSKSGAGEIRPPNAKRNVMRGRIIGSSDGDDDEDELDFLSSGSRSDDVEETSPCKGKRRAMKGQPKKAVVRGQELNYLPGYPPKRKYPNFKKLSKEGSVSMARNKLSDISQEVPKQTSSDGILPTHSRLSGTSSDEGVFVGDTHSLNRVRPRREIQLSDSSDYNQATPRAKHSKGRRPEKFPTLDPLSISDSKTHVQASQKAVAKRKVRLRGPSDRVTSLVHGETVSDRTTPRKHSESSLFPIPSPLSSPVHLHPRSSLSSVRGTKSLSTSDSETDEDGDNQTPKQRPPLRPFPMMATTLKNSIRSPCLRITPTQQRHLGDGGNTIAGDLEEFGDDSLLIGEPADPSLLCPFCDERLPPNPSHLYRSLLEAAKRKAYPDPRPTNPRGLKASMGIYIALCKRHRFEAHQIPEAIAKGWPMDIDFGKVRDRVEKLRDSLGKLVKDEGNARDENIYWTTVIKEVQKMGSRAASSVKGQFESFQRTQPGYYGELGSMVMHQTLFNMFPPSSFDARSVAPLTPQDFIQRVLVPEVALALIMEDTGQDRIQAVRTMRESAGYGVAMFPDTSEGPEVGAGEDIVLERARARRRQLDDEERMEAIFHSMDSEDDKSSKNKGTKRPKKLNSTTTTDIEGTSATRHKMKRKKAGSRTDAESEADDHRRGVMGTREETRGTSSNFATGYSALRSPPRAAPISPSPGSSTLEYNLAQLTQATIMDSKPRSTRCSKRVSINAGVAPIVSPNSPGRPDGRSMSAPIDVDAQVIYVADTTSQSEGEPQHIPVGAPRYGLRSSRTTVGLSGSSDAEIQEMVHDRPTTKPKPRRQLPERAASVGRRLGPNNPLSLSSTRDPGRDSSVE
ncbi:RTC4-like domain-containing protein [Lactarius indigo]|nr:RTC4-like domain-containing protein [Lactarius indigo]